MPPGPLVALALATAMGGAATAPAGVGMSVPVPASDDGFCARAQRIISATPRMPRNLVFDELDGFVRSKPRIRPFEVDQFVTRSPTAGGLPVRVSCKLKSADHLRAEYGPDAAGEELACRDVNRDTAARVYASLTAAERGRLAVRAASIVLEPDVMARTGAGFLGGTDRVWQDAQGRLHLQALALRVDWNDWLWRWMPDRFRGQHACHVVAPEYLRALVLGETKTPADAGVP